MDGAEKITYKNLVICGRYFKKENFKPTILFRVTNIAVPHIVALMMKI